MLIDWTGEFDRWYDQLIERAEGGDRRSFEQLALVDAELGVLQELTAVPDADTPTLRRVLQSRRHQVWRVAHPFSPGTAIRLIVWFPPDRPGEVVLVLLGADKARMGDVFYDSVGPRADAATESYLLRTRTEGDRDE
ncbi:hypothetical protein [Modestobacter lacusdianchii]